jgi:hypothetical protein
VAADGGGDGGFVEAARRFGINLMLDHAAARVRA